MHLQNINYQIRRACVGAQIIDPATREVLATVDLLDAPPPGFEIEEPPPDLTAGQIVKGAVGIAKSAMHIDRADLDTVLARKATCKACEFLDPINGCGKCGCVLRIKIGIAGEKCPAGKW